MPGILNLALSAIGSVCSICGEFTKAASCEDSQEGMADMSATRVAQFAEDECVFGAEYKRASKDLYMAYEQLGQGILESNGILNRKNFTTRLVRLGCTDGQGKRRHENVSRSGFERICFKKQKSEISDASDISDTCLGIPQSRRTVC